MALSKSERFTMKAHLLEEMDRDTDTWDFRRRNLLLSEYGYETMGAGYDDLGFEDSIARITDGDLVEMYSIVTGATVDEVRADVAFADAGNWKPGYIRVFLSHSALHKAFVGQVANELAVAGIHGFVAHDTMEYEQPWQDQIEEALRSMQAFAAIIHPEFSQSAWCNQEVGWALGRRVPMYSVRVGADPAGFIGRTQWPAANSEPAKRVAQHIIEWVGKIPELADPMIDGLLNALRSAGNYIDAGAAASRIASLSSLTNEQWSTLDQIYHQNDQVSGAGLVSRALRPFYQENGRTWPPPVLQIASSEATAAFQAPGRLARN